MFYGAQNIPSFMQFINYPLFNKPSALYWGFRCFLPSSAQAQAQLEAELALFSFDPAPHPPPPTHPHPPVKVYLAAYINQVVTKLQCKTYKEYGNQLVASPV